MSILKRAAKGAVSTAKKMGNAIAVETKNKRPFATKTEDLKAANLNNQTLTQIEAFTKSAKEIQRICKEIHFSYLEKRARESKDKCKTLFSKIKNSTNNETEFGYRPDYEAIRNKTLIEVHKITRKLFLICHHFEEIFNQEYYNDRSGIISRNDDYSNITTLLNRFYDEIKNI